MSDRDQKLEDELRHLKPLAPSPALDSRIAQFLSLPVSSFDIGGGRHSSFRGGRPGDRLLSLTLSAAAASLLVIITLLTTDYLTASTSPPLSQNPSTASLANARLLLAQLTHDSSPTP